MENSLGKVLSHFLASCVDVSNGEVVHVDSTEGANLGGPRGPFVSSRANLLDARVHGPPSTWGRR